MADPKTDYLADILLEELKLYIRFAMKHNEPVIPWPFSDLKYDKSLKVFDELYNDSNKLLAISNEIANQIQLEEDETFCCFLFVANRPKYLTEAIGPTPEPSSTIPDPTPEPAIRMLNSNRFPFGELTASAWPPICYNKIMEPVIMKAVITKREEDIIDYSSK